MSPYGRAPGRLPREQGRDWLDGRPCPLCSGCDDRREAYAREFFPEEYAARQAGEVPAEPTGPAGCVIGLDLGGYGDETALAIVAPDPDGQGVTCGYAATLPLRGPGDEESYHEGQAEWLGDVIGRSLSNVGVVRVLADFTREDGARETYGRVLRQRFGAELDADRLHWWPCWFTAGGTEKWDRGRRLIPKGDMVRAGQADFNRLREGTEEPWLIIRPDFPDTEKLAAQLGQFVGHQTPSGYMRYDARAGHDDMVTALLLALWGLGRDDGPRVVGNPLALDYDRGSEALRRNPAFGGPPVDPGTLPVVSEAAKRADWWGRRSRGAAAYGRRIRR